MNEVEVVFIAAVLVPHALLLNKRGDVFFLQGKLHSLEEMNETGQASILEEGKRSM